MLIDYESLYWANLTGPPIFLILDGHFCTVRLLFVESANKKKKFPPTDASFYWSNFVIFINNVDWLRKLVVSKSTRASHFFNTGWSFLYSRVTLCRIGQQKKLFFPCWRKDRNLVKHKKIIWQRVNELRR